MERLHSTVSFISEKFQQTGSYRYEPLGQKAIRVLELAPSSTFTDPICCTLRPFQLDSDVNFEALSYRWGDSKAMTVIQCNSANLRIRESLETVLRFLRHEEQPRALWIDAISINQNDDHEREQQVPLMFEVYSRAWQVVAWLGEENITDTSALSIEELQYESIDPEDKEAIWKLENYITALLRTMMSAMKVLSREWFSRAWIIQEVAASGSLVMQCSKRTVRWNNFLALLR